MKGKDVSKEERAAACHLLGQILEKLVWSWRFRKPEKVVPPASLSLLGSTGPGRGRLTVFGWPPTAVLEGERTAWVSIPLLTVRP